MKHAAKTRRFWNRGRVVWTILFVAATVPAWGDWRAWVLRKPAELPGMPTSLAAFSKSEEQAVQQDVATAWQDLIDVLAEYHPQALSHLRPGIPEKDVNALERLLGFRFPPHYRASLLLHDGFDPKARLIWWMPNTIAYSLREYYEYQTRPRRELQPAWNATFRRSGWHPRLWKITGENFWARSHALNMETGQVMLSSPDQFGGSGGYVTHRSVNMAEHLRRCAELVVPKSQRSAWKAARR